MKIDHIGYAVKRIDNAIPSFEKLGYKFEDVIDDTDRNVKLCFGENDGYRIELVSPLDKSKKSPVDAYISSIGSTPYHICYKTENLENAIENLIAQGFKVIIPSHSAVAFDGRRVVFMMTYGVGLLEIVEE